ncbi:MAG: methylated-DNA--[protein]-cysteine S-methyltransferase [Actinomycetota bacterium]
MGTYRYDSPIGPLGITLTAQGAVRRVGFGESAGPPLPPGRSPRSRLEAYFRGERDLDDLPVALQASPFRRLVLEAVRRIPPGEVRTYGWLASEIGRPTAARAVGRALAANPLPVVIPCHRVVAASGRLGGYAGGADKKRALLELESSLTA